MSATENDDNENGYARFEMTCDRHAELPTGVNFRSSVHGEIQNDVRIPKDVYEKLEEIYGGPVGEIKIELRIYPTKGLDPENDF